MEVNKKLYNKIWDSYEEMSSRMDNKMAFNLLNAMTLQAITQEACSMLGIENIPFAIAMELDDDTAGYYNGKTNVVVVDISILPGMFILEDNMDMLEKAIGNIMHECRHAYQFFYNKSIMDDYDYECKDMDKYYNHPCEIDAREWAAENVAHFDYMKLVNNL